MTLQGPEYIWVDNSDQSANILMEIFPTVKAVLEDSTHLMRRYMRTLTPGHPSYRELPTVSSDLCVHLHSLNYTRARICSSELTSSFTCVEEFVNDLSKAFFTLHEPDRQALRASLLKGKKLTEQEVSQLPYRYWKEGKLCYNHISKGICLFSYILHAHSECHED